MFTTSFNHAIQSVNSDKWMESKAKNGVWTSVNKVDTCKPIGCKWVFKTKTDADGKLKDTLPA